jgi:hemerythrin-like domain-containing protein
MNNRKKQFEELCEAFGVIETKKRMMYPRGIQFSEQFLQALQEEYERQKLEESQKEKPIREHSTKMLKALQFHIRALDNEQVGLAERQKDNKKVEEDSEEKSEEKSEETPKPRPKRPYDNSGSPPKGYQRRTYYTRSGRSRRANREYD